MAAAALLAALCGVAPAASLEGEAVRHYPAPEGRFASRHQLLVSGRQPVPGRCTFEGLPPPTEIIDGRVRRLVPLAIDFADCRGLFELVQSEI